jgi:hypothetical protein
MRGKAYRSETQESVTSIFATGTRLVWRVACGEGAVSNSLDKLLGVGK